MSWSRLWRGAWWSALLSQEPCRSYVITLMKERWWEMRATSLMKDVMVARGECPAFVLACELMPRSPNKGFAINARRRDSIQRVSQRVLKGPSMP